MKYRRSLTIYCYSGPFTLVCLTIICKLLRSIDGKPYLASPSHTVNSMIISAWVSPSTYSVLSLLLVGICCGRAGASVDGLQVLPQPSAVCPLPLPGVGCRLRRLGFKTASAKTPFRRMLNGNILAQTY